MRDAQLLFSDGQSITANATTVDSTNIVDLGVTYDHVGSVNLASGPEGGRDRLIVTVKAQPTAGTGLYFELYDCATEGGSYTPTGIGIDAANAIPIATLVPGYEMLNVPLPRGLKRFLKLIYTTTGNHTGSAGTVNAGIMPGVTTRNQTPYRA
jgi:hypothetical protein